MYALIHSYFINYFRDHKKNEKDDEDIDWGSLKPGTVITTDFFLFFLSELNVFPLKDEISVNITVEPIIFWMGYRHNEKADFCCDILTNLKWILKKS